MSRDRKKAAIGAETFKFLKSILPGCADISGVADALKSGDFTSARRTLKAMLGPYRPCPVNPFEDDTELVAMNLVGAPWAYIRGLGNNRAGLLTKVSMFTDVEGPRAEYEEVLSAEPGTLGLFKGKTRPYRAVLVSAHKPGEMGVVAFEETTIGDERMKKTDLANLIDAEQEVGKSLYRGTSNLVCSSVRNIPAGFRVERKKEHGGLYFVLRKA